MSDTIISVEGLGKKYVLSHQGERGGYSRFSERLEGWMKNPFAALARGARREVEGNLAPNSCSLAPLATREEFWALKDVSFEVKRGEVVGIIGRNGAGKSTLLKILSRITEPTEGRVTLRGRVASLLEVGTGFHPELTGRENIFLNGAILGMTKAEIRKKFDEIVAFAEVERFLDTPVKRYSSGMYVRLAFAVAAHLEPEILVVDEVLAVGDAEFQKKCLGKMREVSSREGRAVLFVSHNTAAVINLCSRAIQLERGKLVLSDTAEKVVDHYLKKDEAFLKSLEWNGKWQQIGNSKLSLRRIKLECPSGGAKGFIAGQPVHVVVDFEIHEKLERPTPFIDLLDEDGVHIFNAIDLPSASLAEDTTLNGLVLPGFYRSTVTIPGDLLNERRYAVRVGFNTRWTQFEFFSPELVWLEIQPSESMRAEHLGSWPGLVRPRLRWVTVRTNRPEK